MNTDGPETVRELHWRFNNNSRVPEVEINSEYDVGMVVYLVNNTWIGLLRMNRVQQSFAGIYKCVANFSGMPKSRSMEIQVSGGCPFKCNIPGNTPWEVCCTSIMYVFKSNIAPTWAASIFK